MNFAQTLSATPSSLGLIPQGNRSHTCDDEPQDATTTQDMVDNLQAEMMAAYDDHNDAHSDSVKACLTLGRIAMKVKPLVGHTNYTNWLESWAPFSAVWCRSCVRAAEVYDLMIEADESHPFYAAFQEANTIEKLAKLLAPVQGKLPKERKKDLSSDEHGEVVDVLDKNDPSQSEAERLRVWAESLDMREQALRVAMAALARRTWAVEARERACGIDPVQAAQEGDDLGEVEAAFIAGAIDVQAREVEPLDDEPDMSDAEAAHEAMSDGYDVRMAQAALDEAAAQPEPSAPVDTSADDSQAQLEKNREVLRKKEERNAKDRAKRAALKASSSLASTPPSADQAPVDTQAAPQPKKGSKARK